jgi:tRNA(Ile)-lysidine synthetase-like protein
MDPDTKAKADSEITSTFLTYEADHWIDHVIYLDQFMRHFQRVLPDKITEAEVGLARIRATHIVTSNSTKLAELDEFELVFCLMPFKHIGDYEFIFTTIHERWLMAHIGTTLTDYPLLMKFYVDSYTKYYTIEHIFKTIVCYDSDTYVSEFETYDPKHICDSYPDRYKSETWLTQPLPEVAKPLLKLVADHAQPMFPTIVSLSGGVDSMVMCYLLKRSGISVQAVHIVYGNRDVSEAECLFLRSFCKRLSIPLYVYRVEWLRRGQVEREFYEEMTRKLRFMAYTCIGGKNTHISLGHIYDDMIENIWTNFAHGTHLEYLVKMKPVEYMDGVHIHRPWLTIKKSTIYTLSEALGIPYLKNTTPAWSNRGKFRDTFYAATHTQFGTGVDSKILESATAISKQAAIIEKLLYKPIYDSWNSETRTLDITPGVRAELDANGWSRIFTTICHSKVKLSKPSIHSCAEFTKRIVRPHGKMPLKKDVQIEWITSATGSILLTFHVV